MKVKKKQLEDQVIQLTIDVAAEDYSPALKKKLNEFKRNAEFKGFRKGNVPMPLIEKLYGDQALVDAANDIVSDELNKFITKEKLEVMGEPISSESQPQIEWKNGNDLKFIFDIATSPKVDFEVVKEDTVEHYNVTLTAAAKKEMKDNLLKYDEKKKELSEEELDKEVTEYLKNSFKQQATYRLDKDIRQYFIDKASISLPENFLKRWLLQVNKGKVTEEQLEKEFPAFISDYRWQLVREFLMGKFSLKVEEKDVEDAAAAFVSYQYAMYGLTNVPEDAIKDAVKNVLGDSNQVQRLIENVEDQKVIAALKEAITIKDKKISAEKFRELK